MNRTTLASAFLSTSLFALAAGCDERPRSGSTGPGASHAPRGSGDHEHGGVIPIGTADVAGFAITAKRGEKVEPGGEMDLDLEFAEGVKRPSLVRAWIGAEDAAGARKALLGNTGDRAMHGHLEVPEPLAEGARVWIEVEDGAAKGRGSFPLSR